MKKRKKHTYRKAAAAILTGAAVLTITACGDGEGFNLAKSNEAETRTVTLYSPMEKTNPNAENVARSACDKTIVMAEENLTFPSAMSPIRRKIIRTGLTTMWPWTGRGTIWTIFIS